MKASRQERYVPIFIIEQENRKSNLILSFSLQQFRGRLSRGKTTRSLSSQSWKGRWPNGRYGRLGSSGENPTSVRGWLKRKARDGEATPLLYSPANRAGHSQGGYLKIVRKYPAYPPHPSGRLRAVGYARYASKTRPYNI